MTDASSWNPLYDVVVVGGGPAGSALATFLARQGHAILILERSQFPRYHIGESLIPHTFDTLDRLGLLPHLRGSDFPEKHSVRFVSQTGKTSTPFYFSERISGEGARTWQVERSEFDIMMLEHARNEGAEVAQNAQVQEILFDEGRAVGARVVQDGAQTFEVRSRVVVDASGAATILGRQLGLRNEIPGLEKATCWDYYRGGVRLDGIDAGETTIFRVAEGGWFWYIPLPDDIVSVGIVAEHDYLFDQTDDAQVAFLRQVEKCAPLMERLARAERTGPVRHIPRLAYVNGRTCGDGWLMIGDARAFLDPIYSSGLFLALASAELAAQCVHEALDDDDCSAARLGRFEPTLGAGVEVIRRLIHAFYDPQFSFGAFVERFPEHRAALIDCLIGDVLGKDMDPFLQALAQMTPPPAPL